MTTGAGGAGLLAGKRCIVTGASRGIGAAIAKAYAKEGAALHLTATNCDNLRETEQFCTAAGCAEVHLHAVNMAIGGEVQSFVDSIIETHGGVDVLVNNAGVDRRFRLEDGEMNEWNEVVEVNLNAPMRLIKAFSPYMKEKKFGAILTVASIAATKGMPTTPLYAATKWGIRGFCLSCHEALKEFNVKVMLINPAYVLTDMTAGREGCDTSRMMTTSDIAEVALMPLRLSVGCVPVEVLVDNGPRVKGHA